jgi:hypothetical protein
MLQTIDGVDTDSIKITGLASKLSGAIKTIKQEIDKLKKGFLGGRIMVETLI